MAALSRHLRHAVRVQPAAVDQKIAREGAGRRFRHPFPASLPQMHDSCPRRHVRPVRRQLRRQDLADPRIVDDALLRHAERGDAAHVRLDLAHGLRLQPLQARQAIGCAALRQRLEPRNFAFVRRHHQLAADLVRHAVFLAESYHLADAFHRQPRFERPRLVIQAAMQHTAVVPGLMLPQGGLLFEHRNARAGNTFREPQCRREPHNAAADDDDPPRVHPTNLAQRGRPRVQ